MPPNLGEQSIFPYLDLIPPYLALYYPLDGHAQRSQDLLLGGIAEPFSTILITATNTVSPQVIYTDLAIATELGTWQVEVKITTDGVYTLTVQAVDRAGNPGTPVSVSVIVDTTGPVLSELSLEPRRYLQSSLNLRFYAQWIDLTGVYSAEVVVIDVPDPDDEWSQAMEAGGNGWYSPQLVLTGTIEGRKPFTLTAVDLLGNVSVYTDTGFIVDDTHPQVSNPELDTGQGQNLYLNPAYGLYYGPNSSGFLRVTVTANDPQTNTPDVAGLDWLQFPDIMSGPANLEYNGELTTTISHTYTVTGTDAGSYQVTTQDRTWNQGQCTQFVLVYDDVAPLIEEVYLSQANAQNVYLTGLTLYYGPLSSGTLDVTVTANEVYNSEESGLSHVAFPALFGLGAQDDSISPYQRSYPITTTPDGEYLLQALDQVGNAATSPFTVIQDAISPTVTVFVQEQAGLLFEVAWAGYDAGTGVSEFDVQYKVDNGAWNDWMMNTQETEARFVAESGHTYTFRVTARDRVGNVGQDEATVQVLSVVKYYAFAGQRVAMRRCGGGDCRDAVYLHGDHLGSVSLATDDQGNLLSQARYTPYGQVRWNGDTVMPTKFAFTGQRQDGFGLMDYNARFYSPKLGRFVSADSIIPNAMSPQAFDRFAYVLNNPVHWA
jgi:RHS repeat-associated protein